jgi:hypothetical protein
LGVFADVDLVDFVGEADRLISVIAGNLRTRRVCGNRDSLVPNELLIIHPHVYEHDSLATERNSFWLREISSFITASCTKTMELKIAP